jgi:hypothetical protein
VNRRRRSELRVCRAAGAAADRRKSRTAGRARDDGEPFAVEDCDPQRQSIEPCHQPWLGTVGALDAKSTTASCHHAWLGTRGGLGAIHTTRSEQRVVARVNGWCHLPRVNGWCRLPWLCTRGALDAKSTTRSKQRVVARSGATCQNTVVPPCVALHAWWFEVESHQGTPLVQSNEWWHGSTGGATCLWTRRAPLVQSNEWWHGVVPPALSSTTFRF